MGFLEPNLMSLQEEIDKKLAVYGFSAEDLTKEEMDALIAETEHEIKFGPLGVDGILSTIPPYRNLKL